MKVVCTEYMQMCSLGGKNSIVKGLPFNISPCSCIYKLQRGRGGGGGGGGGRSIAIITSLHLS